MLCAKRLSEAHEADKANDRAQRSLTACVINIVLGRKLTLTFEGTAYAPKIVLTSELDRVFGNADDKVRIELSPDDAHNLAQSLLRAIAQETA